MVNVIKPVNVSCEELHNLYIEKDLPITAIAKILNCNPATVHRKLLKFNIPIKIRKLNHVPCTCKTCGKVFYFRPSPSALKKRAFCSVDCRFKFSAITLPKKSKVSIAKEYLEYKYFNENKSIREIAEEYGVGESSVYRLFKLYNIKTKKCTWKFHEIQKELSKHGLCPAQMPDNALNNALNASLPKRRLRNSLSKRGEKHYLAKGKSPLNGYGSNWTWIKKLVKLRDGNKCQVCGLISTDKNFQVHHIVPKKLFFDVNNANVLGNLITLCPLCHEAAAAKFLMDENLNTRLLFSMPKLRDQWQQEYKSLICPWKKTKAMLRRAW